MINTRQVAVACILLIVAVLGGWYMTEMIRKRDPLQDKWLLTRGMDRPVVWIYLNNSDVNSRYWKDFGSRSSRVINIPFLNLCYETIVKATEAGYRVEVIAGLADLAERLGGWNAMPSGLQNVEASVREPELTWIRAAVLAKWGGLWVDPATIFLRPMEPLPIDRVVLFGTDQEVTYAGSAGTAVPGLRVAWSPVHDHPFWVSWEEKVRERLEKRAGGSEFRHDEKSDMAALMNTYAGLVEVRPTAELTRKGKAGKRIQVEDLLAAGTEGDLPFDLKCDAIFMPVPWPEIKERRAFGWFLRMSEDQILDSDLAISWVFRRVLS